MSLEQADDKKMELLTTFYVDNAFLGLEVMMVQEITGNPQVIPVPLAPEFVRGLVNLRGQIATAIGLNKLMNSQHEGGTCEEEMAVVCKSEGNLISLIVDSIGDVVEVDSRHFEATPDTVPINLRKFIKGVYKLDGCLLSVLDIEAIFKELSPLSESSVARA